MKKYLMLFGIVSGLIALAAYLLQKQFGYALIHQYIFQMQLLMGLMTLINHRICQQGLEKQPDSFHLYYMGTMTARFFGVLMIITGYLFAIKLNSKVFAMNFLVLYLFYTIFEIYTLLANLRPNKKQR